MYYYAGGRGLSFLYSQVGVNTMLAYDTLESLIVFTCELWA